MLNEPQEKQIILYVYEDGSITYHPGLSNGGMRKIATDLIAFADSVGLPPPNGAAAPQPLPAEVVKPPEKVEEATE